MHTFHSGCRSANRATPTANIPVSKSVRNMCTAIHPCRIVTTGLLTHTQCVSNSPLDVLHKYRSKRQTSPVFCATAGTHTSFQNTGVCVRSSPTHDVLPAARRVSMETLVLESPALHILASMVTHGDMRLNYLFDRRRPHSCWSLQQSSKMYALLHVHCLNYAGHLAASRYRSEA